MPKEVFGPNFAFLPSNHLLTFEEITRLVKLFKEEGVRKIRLTGGEPLLRKGIDELVSSISQLGVDDIALTTNGSMLTNKMARRLKDAGLHRVTISLDSLDNDAFMAMNDVRFPVSKVLDAIHVATNVGLSPVKINMVVKRGWNEQSILAMANYFRGTGCVLRFIEYMDVGNSNGWNMNEVVMADEIISVIHSVWPLRRKPPKYVGEVAQRYEYLDGQGEIGVVASVTRAFCGACTRARLSSEGRLYTCLFASKGHDLRSMLRSGASDSELRSFISRVWLNRDDRYSELRSALSVRKNKVEMSHIGG
ncbi:cyclic pyranopterin monophosphate synthase [Alicyclobacillus fastidiosus]|nr:cyclic pyranopterin monophosphate synthase [Alicyclobacillus fastidiosus]